MREPLFTPRFFIMCTYTFTVFVSVFQLLPTAPYRILDLGGSTTAAGLFLGFLTYASASSAPFTGHIGDRIGQRQVLMRVSAILAVCTFAYTFVADYRIMLGLVLIHGFFWSALLAASGAYMTSTIPASRRAEGLGYWGMASVSAIAVAPALGFWVYHHGWVVFCSELVALHIMMGVIAWRLPDDRHAPASVAPSSPHLRAAPPSVAPASPHPRDAPQSLVEHRVLLLSVAMGLVSFGYGGLTSFSSLFADALHVEPRSLFLTVMAVAILAGRLGLGRRLDDVGHRRVLLPALVVPATGLALLSVANGEAAFLISAALFGAGFGLMYPAFAAYVMGHVSPGRRGAAFGAMIAAFDMGIGTGSSILGWTINEHGFRVAFAGAAVLALAAAPYFLVAERRLGFLNKVGLEGQ
jgi:MFS family permease